MTFQLLETLRTLLHAPPSVQAWSALCQLFEERRPTPTALDYVLEHLQHWPRSLRCAPASWMSLLHTKYSPLEDWSLAIQHLNMAYCPITPSFLTRWATLPSMEHITSLSLVPSSCDVHLLESLLKAQPMPQCARLDLHISYEDEDEEPKLGSLSSLLDHCTGLRHLGFHGVDFGPSWSGTDTRHFHDVLEHPTTSQLTSLVLVHAHLSEEQLITLFAHPSCTHIQHLDLSHNNLARSSVLSAMESGASLPSLRVLSLQSTNLHRIEASPLYRTLNSDLTRTLTSLDLSCNGLGRFPIPPLQNARDLFHLDLSGNQLTSLPFLDKLTSLRSLNVSSNPLKIESRDFAGLLANTPVLESLDVSHTRVKTQSFEALPTCSTLRVLKSTDAMLKTSAAKRIAAWDLPALEHLDLSANNLSLEAVEILTTSPKLPSLRHLNVAHNSIPDVSSVSHSSGVAVAFS